MKITNILGIGRISLLDLLKKEHSGDDTSTHLDKAVQWLCLAQDKGRQGGVSEGYHLFHGWLPPYPETTGYIIETFFDYWRLEDNVIYKERAVRMADWLLSIQNEDGSIPDSYLDKKRVFDTGQVVFGFVRCFEETGAQKYKAAAEKAGEWLLKVQREDGSWIQFAVDDIPHTYYSRVAWSLLKLHKITSDDRYLDSCVKNIEWCLKQQQENGWFDHASFNLGNHSRPFTHTIAYTIDGMIESGFYLGEKRYISSAAKAIDPIVERLPQDGYVPGAFRRDWSGEAAFTCLTGDAQLAINMFRLYASTSDEKYLLGGKRINAYLKRKQEFRTKNRNIDGALAGSYPIWGKYIHFMYPNWAAKFFSDSLMWEEKLSERSGG